MTYLVDTHVLLWALDDSPRLGPHTRASLLAARSVHVSSISVLEIVIKSMTGRLRLPDALRENLSGQIVAQGFELLPFSAAHAAAVADLPGLARHDPFDRALLAQARSERLRFVTADRVLLDLGLDGVDDAGR